MKFTSIALIATLASSAFAVIPRPTPGCSKVVKVIPQDTGCIEFAKKYGTTFQNMLDWNTKLSEKCTNLDVNEFICLSLDPKFMQANGQPLTIEPIYPSSTGVATGAPTQTAQPTVTKAPVTVPGATSAPASAAPTGASSAPAPPAGATRTVGASNPTPTPNSAVANKGSLLVAAAGIVLSAAYML